MPPQIRLAVDVGGTFTDVVLEQGDQQTTLKVLTTPAAPETGVLTGIDAVLAALIRLHGGHEARVVHLAHLAR